MHKAEEIELWLDNPLTKNLLQALYENKEQDVNAIKLGAPLKTENALIEYAHLVGRIQVYDLFLENIKAVVTAGENDEDKSTR